jgi:hypothetical protein
MSFSLPELSSEIVDFKSVIPKLCLASQLFLAAVSAVSTLP